MEREFDTVEGNSTGDAALAELAAFRDRPAGGKYAAQGIVNVEQPQATYQQFQQTCVSVMGIDYAACYYKDLVDGIIVYLDSLDRLIEETRDRLTAYQRQYGEVSEALQAERATATQTSEESRDLIDQLQGEKMVLEEAIRQMRADLLMLEQRANQSVTTFTQLLYPSEGSTPPPAPPGPRRPTFEQEQDVEQDPEEEQGIPPPPTVVQPPTQRGRGRTPTQTTVAPQPRTRSLSPPRRTSLVKSLPPP